MKRFHRLRRDERGAAVVELALSLPILITVIYGIFQMSQLMEADASMQHALGEGARYASLCIPTSTGCNLNSNTTVQNRMSSKLFGTLDGTFNVQNVVDGTNSKTLTITYTQTMNFLFFTGPSVTLTRSKLVYTPAAN
jgi:Flp pilus assembly protein TadG